MSDDETSEPQVLGADEVEGLSNLQEQMERCCQQLELEALQRAGDLLRRETESLRCARTVVEAQQRAEFLQRLSLIVADACSKLEAKMHLAANHVTSLRSTLADFYDELNRKLVSSSRHRPTSSKGQDSKVCEERHEADDKMAEARAAHARAAVARASAHVSRAEQQVAILDREASQAALEASEAAERAKVAEELAAELRERERAAQEELREKEKKERELERKLKEEQKRREEQWERHTAQLKKRASTIDLKTLDAWTTHSYNVDGGDTGIEVGCMVRVEPGLLERSDLDVVRVDQLTAGTLLEDGEELVSNVIHIRASVVVSDLNPPSLVALPYVTAQRYTANRTYVIKMTSSVDNSWSPVVTEEVAFDQLPELRFVQSSISCLQSVYLAVVTQLKRQHMNITRRVTSVASTFDPRLTISLDTSKCSRVRSVSFVLEVQAIDTLFLQDVRQRYRSTCSHLVTTSPVLRITSSPDTRSAASHQPVIILVPIPPSPIKRQPTPQPKPALSTAKRPATSARTTRRSAANARNNRPQTANAAVLSAPPTKAVSDDVPETVLNLLTKADDDSCNDQWKLSATKLKPSRRNDVIALHLEGLPYGRLVIFRSTAGVTTTQLEEAASQIEKYASQRFVHTLVRQQDCHRDDAALVRQWYCHHDDADNRTVNQMN